MPFPHSTLRINLTDNVRVRTYPHGPCRPQPLPVLAERSFPNIFSLPDDDRCGKKVGNDFGRDQKHTHDLIDGACFDKAVIIRPGAPPPGRQARQLFAEEHTCIDWFSNTAVPVCKSRGTCRN